MAQFPAVLSLLSLNGTNGFKLSGEVAGDNSGRAVASAGDVNNDGFADLIIGAHRHNGDFGAAYIVFGKAGTFGTNVNLGALVPATGFKLSGAADDDFTGDAVASAGDVNGDGFDDVIIGARSIGGAPGSAYVVFGKASGFADLDLATLSAADGFKLSGTLADGAGWSVASANINGDGFDDLIIGAIGAKNPDNTDTGAAYVVIGKSGGFGTNIDLASLNGTTGFKLSSENVNDNTGRSVASAGDVNGDGIEDLIVGAHFASGNGIPGQAGASYVVFGKTTLFSANINLAALNGTTGFKIGGAQGEDQSGISVAGAGDVNGDGFDDLIVGAEFADPHGAASGAAYVVFGKASFADNVPFSGNIPLHSLDGRNGFKISGVAIDDRSGRSVAGAGDVNGDGLADLIVGAHQANANGADAGATYVVFGTPTGFSANIDLSSLNGTSGFKLTGGAAGDHSGFSVASAGDINNDGIDDLIVGADQADPNGGQSGASYVVYGRPPVGRPTNIALSDITVAENSDEGTLVGLLSASDPNAGETFIFTLTNSAGGRFAINGNRLVVAGSLDFEAQISHTITIWVTDSDQNHFKKTFTIQLTNVLDGTNGDDTVTGTAGNDSLEGHAGTDTLRGLGGDDTLNGGLGADHLEGGTGTDTATYAKAAAAVTIHLDRLTPNTGEANGDTFSSIERIEGSRFGDNLFGSVSRDTFAGGDGNDRLEGRQGQDALDGEDGNDTILGGSAADVLRGGADNDNLSGDANDNSLFGDDGNDTLKGGTGIDTLNGGAGDDSLSGNGTLEGGADNDRLTGSGMLRGGGGNDIITPTNLSVTTIDAGAGNDEVRINIIAAMPVTLGADADRVVVTGWNNSASISITDFGAGAGSDQVDISAVLENNLIDWDGDANPFGTVAFIRIVQDGDDTLLQVDRDGSAGSAHDFRTLITFRDVIAANFGRGNILPPYPLDGTALGEDISGGTGGDNLPGTTLADTIDSGAGNDTVNAGQGDDLIFAGAGNDTANGGQGEDAVNGGVGDDKLDGGVGDDAVVGADGADQIGAGSGNDTVDAGAGNDTVTGGDGTDEIHSGSGNDIVDGGAGNDVIVGGDGSGNDRYIGGVGLDTVRYISATLAITVDLATGKATGVQIGQDTLSGIENVIAGRGNDTVTGNAAANVLQGGSGKDKLAGGAGLDTADYSDKAGAVVVTLNGAANVAVKIGSAIEDTIRSIENIIGGNGHDRIIGDSLANVLTGGNGNDTLDGRLGADILQGALGNDTLLGGAGNDVLNGGLGNDVLTGGTGSDAFLFDTAPHKTFNLDRITDFNVVADSVRLENAAFKALGGAAPRLAADKFFVGSGAHDATDRIIYNKITGALLYDADGLGGVVATQFAKLAAGLALTHADFMVV